MVAALFCDNRTVIFYLVMEDKNLGDLQSNSENSEPDNKEKQTARCILREKFLRAVTGVVGKECTFHMYPNTNVVGVFRGNDMEFEILLADNLKTPFAEVAHTKIRSSDVHYIEFNNFLGIGDLPHVNEEESDPKGKQQDSYLGC